MVITVGLRRTDLGKSSVNEEMQIMVVIVFNIETQYSGVLHLVDSTQALSTQRVCTTKLNPQKRQSQSVCGLSISS